MFEQTKLPLFSIKLRLTTLTNELKNCDLSDPFVENHVVHVAKEADHEDHHWATLTEEVHHVALSWY